MSKLIQRNKPCVDYWFRDNDDDDDVDGILVSYGLCQDLKPVHDICSLSYHPASTAFSSLNGLWYVHVCWAECNWNQIYREMFSRIWKSGRVCEWKSEICNNLNIWISVTIYSTDEKWHIQTKSFHPNGMKNRKEKKMIFDRIPVCVFNCF